MFCFGLPSCSAGGDSTATRSGSLCIASSATPRPGVVFFLGGGYLEVSGSRPLDGAGPVSLWRQVRDVSAEHPRLKPLDVDILGPPQREAWGLIEMWVADADGVRLVLVEVPADHPLLRGNRTEKR